MVIAPLSGDSSVYLFSYPSFWLSIGDLVQDPSVFRNALLVRTGFTQSVY